MKTRKRRGGVCVCVWKTPNNYLVTEDTFLSTMFGIFYSVLLYIKAGVGFFVG